MHFVVGTDNRGSRTFGAEQQRIDGHSKARRIDLRREVYLRVGSGKELPSRIGNIDLCQQSTRGGIDRFRRSYDLAFELLTGILALFEERFHADLDGRAVSFGQL